jgi:uncharacterized protein YndB with AHSA1/START domain
MSHPNPTDRASRILSITRVFAASRERVFQAFTDPDLVALWWGPDGFSTPRASLAIEPRVGGRHHKVMVLESREIAEAMGMQVGAEFPDSAHVIEIVAPELLVLSSEAQPDMGLVEDTITRIEFHAEGPARTRVVLIDGPYAEMMATHAQAGWTQSFAKLARMLED